MAGERSGLFFEIMRLVREIRPKFIFLENVPAIRTRGLDTVLKELTKERYDCRWTMLSASDFGAPHKRERWFLLAHSNGESCARLQSGKKTRQPKLRMCAKSKTWDAWPENESPLLGMDDELPFRLDRTKALGNAVVPCQAREAFKILMGIK